MWEATETTASVEIRGGSQIEDPLGGTQEGGVEGKYCMGTADMEESASGSTERSGEETEESASGGEAKTAEGAGEARTMLTTEGTEERGSETGPGGVVDGGGATSGATAVESDAAGAGGGVMGRKSGKGRGFLAGGENQLASPLDW